MQLHFEWQKYCLTNINSKKQISNSGGIFVFEPTNYEYLNLGYIFIAVNYINKQENNLINNLLYEIKKEYYSKPHRKPYESFESALVKANKYLTDLIEKGEINWLGKLNLNCLIFAENIIYYTQIENARFLMMRENILTDPGQPFKNIKYNPLKPFTYIINGKIFEKDRLLLIAGNIDNYIKDKDLKNLFSDDKEFKLKEIQNKLLQEKEPKRLDLIYITFKIEKTPVKIKFNNRKLFPFYIEPLKTQNKKIETEPIKLKQLINEIKLKQIKTGKKINRMKI